MPALKIITTSIALAIVYGIIHDLITAHISVEYFTVGHPKIIESESPIQLALLWGVLATWWVGAILGSGLALSASVGSYPKIGGKDLMKPLLKLLGVMALSALIAGMIGYILTKTEVIYLADHLASQISPERHHLFLVAGWAHSASYLVGFIGGIVICVKTWRKRRGLSKE